MDAGKVATEGFDPTLRKRFESLRFEMIIIRRITTNDVQKMTLTFKRKDEHFNDFGYQDFGYQQETETNGMPDTKKIIKWSSARTPFPSCYVFF